MLVSNDYFFIAGYTVLSFVVLATAWNILGGYAGYVNFGSAGLFATGVYTSVILYNLCQPPLLVSIFCGAAVAALVSAGTGYLTLRLKGVYFSIATLALTMMLLTLVVNWDYVGGSRGAYIVAPAAGPFGLGKYLHWLYGVMVVMAAGSILIARLIETSAFGRGLAAIRDNEVAAESLGVPTVRLKLAAASLSGALMGMAGAVQPYFTTYVEPHSVFNLSYAINAIAMPVVGGMASWVGPLLGALLLGTVQQVATVTISSELNLLIVGVLLVAFVSIAPNGLLGLAAGLRRHWNDRRARAADGNGAGRP
jgi:branched-chain amino acid transport system permease protein